MLQFIRFCAVGVLGFLADSGMLLLVTGATSLGPLPSRLISFSFAATVTWYTNRRYTFHTTRIPSVAEWGHYILLTSIGALINLSIFELWVMAIGARKMQLVLGVALGSIAALAWNYGVSSQLIFRSHR